MTHGYVLQENGSCDDDMEIVSHDCQNLNGWTNDHEICLVDKVIDLIGAMNAPCSPSPLELHSNLMMTRKMKNGRAQKSVFALVDMRTEPLGVRAREVPA